MISSLISFVIYVIVLGLVVWVLLWFLKLIPLPEPFGRVAYVGIIVIAVIALIWALLQVVGVSVPVPRT